MLALYWMHGNAKFIYHLTMFQTASVESSTRLWTVTFARISPSPENWHAIASITHVTKKHATYIQTTRRGITVVVHSTSRTGSGFQLSVTQARINSQSDNLVLTLPLWMSCPSIASLMYQRLPPPTSSMLEHRSGDFNARNWDSKGKIPTCMYRASP